MKTHTAFYTLPAPLPLQEGAVLPDVRIAYETYGTLNADRSNAILLFHALSGSQHAAGFRESVEGVGDRWTDECKTGWWDGFIGPGRALNTDRFFVICANYLGGCYGTTGPSSMNPETGQPYGSSFPRVTITDMVDCQVQLLDHLGIDQLHAAVGASIGGFLSAAFAVRYPGRARLVVPIGSSFEVSILQRIHNFEQINAIANDPHFNGGDYYGGPCPDSGLSLARMIAHKTYLSLHAIEERASREIKQPDEGLAGYKLQRSVESYLFHQGNKFVSRFDANTYLRIVEAWQRFDLLRENPDAEAASLTGLFQRCTDQQFLLFSIDSDVCFYPDEQQNQARILRTAGVRHHHITVHSDRGHDGFLLQPGLFTPHLAYTLENLDFS